MAYLQQTYDKEKEKEQAPQPSPISTEPARTSYSGISSSPAYSVPDVSNSYYSAVNALANASEKPVYANTYGDRLNELYDQIVNRPKFQYDVNADPLYQSLRDQYTQMGKLAMRDTVAQGAGLTGGYDNTYAQQVGQQQYDAYLQNLTEAIPDLYGQALNQYNNEGNALYQQYGLLGDLAADEYGKYRDALSDYNYNQEWEYQQRQDELNRAFQERQYASDLEQQQWNRDFAERQYLSDLEQQQWERDFAQQQLAQQYELALLSRSGGSGGGYYGNSGYVESYGYSDIASLATQAAAGGANPTQINNAVKEAISSPSYNASAAQASGDYVRAMRAAADAARNAGTYNPSEWRFVNG